MCHLPRRGCVCVRSFTTVPCIFPYPYQSDLVFPSHSCPSSPSTHLTSALPTIRNTTRLHSTLGIPPPAYQPRKLRSVRLLSRLSHPLGPFLALLSLLFTSCAAILYHNPTHHNTSPHYTAPSTLALISPSPPWIAPAVALCLSSGHSSLRNFQVLVPPAALSRRTRQPFARLAIHQLSQRQ